MSDAGTATNARALAHPLRVSIVLTMAEHGDEISPLEIAKQLGQGLGVVSYHVRFLRKMGAIELARTQPVRGANQSFYVLAAAGTEALALTRQGGVESITPTGATTTKQDFAALGRALMNPLRMQMLRELAEANGDLSPRELSELLGKPLGMVSYHVRFLHNLGYIELVRTEAVRGAIAHFYGLSPGMREFMPFARQIAPDARPV